MNDSCTSGAGKWLLTQIYKEFVEWFEVCQNRSSTERKALLLPGTTLASSLSLSTSDPLQASQNSSVLVEGLYGKHGKAKVAKPD